MKQSHLLLFAALIPSIAFTADLNVFGFALGAPLTLPECPSQVVLSTKVYDVTPSITCFEEPHKINGYGAPARRIIFSQKDAPTVVKWWHLIALESGGVLIGIEFNTIGVAAQQTTLDTLTQKYGKPAEITHRQAQNKMGASFDAIRAAWTLPELSVDFDGVAGSLDSGRVRIDLPQGVRLREEWAKQLNSGRPL